MELSWKSRAVLPEQERLEPGPLDEPSMAVQQHRCSKRAYSLETRPAHMQAWHAPPVPPGSLRDMRQAHIPGLTQTRPAAVPPAYSCKGTTQLKGNSNQAPLS